jgi:hypothetical protein
MEKESFTIMRNLGYTDELISSVKKECAQSKDGVSKKALKLLEEIGTPDSALKAIKIIETKAIRRRKVKQEKASKNKMLIESLIKRCRRSFDAFSRKGVNARVVFKKNQPWVIEAPEYHPAMQHFHDVCKKHFDVWADQGISVVFQFGSGSWRVVTRRKSDQPDNI